MSDMLPEKSFFVWHEEEWGEITPRIILARSADEAADIYANDTFDADGNDVYEVFAVDVDKVDKFFAEIETRVVVNRYKAATA